MKDDREELYSKVNRQRRDRDEHTMSAQSVESYKSGEGKFYFIFSKL